MNNFALSATDIGDAMQRSASVLAASNTSFDESIALITAGNEILQDPEKTGTALRTIALRIRGAKSELEEMGEETDYVIHSTSKLRELIKGYTSIGGKYEGFDIMEDENTFKSLSEIIKGIGKVYDEMSDIDRTAMLEKLAGKNRSNALAAMLQNYKQIDAVLASIEESEGSALRENEHIVDSIQGRITILQTSAENFWQSFLDTDFVKNAVSSLTDLLNILTKITDTIGGGGITAIGATGLLTYKSGMFQSIFKSYKDLKIAEDLLSKATKGTEDYARKLNAVNNASLEYQKSTTALTRVLNKWTIGIGIAAAALSYFIGIQIKHIKKVREMADEYVQSNKRLNDYKDQIRKLHEVLDDESSTTDEVVEAKEQLNNINNDLMDSYSGLKGYIDAANMSLQDTIDLIDKVDIDKLQMLLATAQAQKWGVARAISEGEYLNAFTIGNITSNESDRAVAEDFLRNGIKYSKSAKDTFDEAEYYNNIIFTATNAYEQLSIINNELLKQSKIIQSDTATKEEKDAAQRLSNRLNEFKDELEASFKNYENIGASLGYDVLSSYANETSEIKDIYNDYYNAQKAYAIEKTQENKNALSESIRSIWEHTADEDKGAIEAYFNAVQPDVSFFEKWRYENWLNEKQYEDIYDQYGNLSQHISVGTNEELIKNIGKLSGGELKEQDWINWANSINTGIEYTEEQINALNEFKDFVKNNPFTAEQIVQILVDAGYAKTPDQEYFEQRMTEARNAATNLGVSDSDFEKLGITTVDEIDRWLDIAKVAKDAEEAVRMYYLATAGFGATLDSSTILKNMQEQYKPAFEALAESYKEIFDDKNNYKGISKITAEKLQGVNAQFEEINKKLKEAGLDMIPQDAINSFLDTLSTEDILDDSFTTKAEEVHAAYNNIATTIVDSLNPALGQASFETVNLMIKQLKQLGVTNAEEVVFTRLGYTIDECSTAMDTYAAAKEAADAVGLDLDKDVSEFSATEWAAISSDEAIMEYYRHRARLMAENISTVKDVQNLVNLTEALGDTTVGAIALAEAISRLDTINANTEKIDTLNEKIQNAGRTGNWRGIAEYQQQIDALKKENADITSSLLEDVKYEAEFASSEWNGNEVTSSTDKDSDSKQKFDWIERAIKKIQRAVTNLGKVADATYKTWGERLDAIMGKTEEFHDEIGQFGRGNIDLYNRPQYINEDGSVSTVRSMSFGDEFGNEILVPTIAFDNNGNPYSMSDDEAIARYYETGEYLGLFKSIEEAEEYAEKLHEQQEAIYTGNDSFYAGKYQKLKEEIALQQQAADAYMQEANAIGLSAEYRSKVMNGLMDIETITDERLKEQISDFQELYDKSTDCLDSISDLEAEIAQLAQTKFDNITKQFEEMALAIDHAATRIGHIQSKMDSEGYFESSALIKQLKSGTEEKLGQLKEEATQLATSIDEAVANGDIDYGSEQWWNMWDALQNVNDQIVEATSSIASFDDQIRQLEWDKFDYIAEAVNRLTEENNFLIDVLQGEEQMFEKIGKIGEDYYANGNFSDAALAVQGLHVNNLQILEEQNRTYAEEIKKINKELANDPNNKKLLERRNDLIDQQQDIIKGIDDEKHAIKDLIQEGYETFLDYLQKSIDYRKQALEAEKNLYDYESTVEEQTKAIASYQKQISALGGDDSEETQARLQELANNLNAAEKELQKTEYEQWLSDQEKMMDNMYSSFEKLINDRLDDLDGLVEQAIQQTADSATAISQTIQTEADEFIYELDNTAFGANIDARMSDAIYAVDMVRDAINNMINAANVNAQNELAQLQALAATVATQAAVNANTVPQVTVPTGGTGGDTSDKNITKKDTADHTKEIQELNNQLRDLERLYDYALQMNHHYSQRAGKSAYVSERNELLAQAGEYAVKASEYKKKIDAIEKQIKQLKNAKYAKGGTIGNAIKKSGEDGIILARSGEEVLSLERVKQMQQVFKMMEPLTNLGSNTNIGGNTTVNGMSITFDLPNVTSYEDFVNKAKSDPTFEKLVQNMTIGTSLGRNKLSKYSI